MTRILNLTILTFTTATLIAIDLSAAIAGSLLCPAGTQLASDSFSCVQSSAPSRRQSSSGSTSNYGNQVGVGIGAASAILSIASILGESLTPTDNLGSPAYDRPSATNESKTYGTLSREANRQGLLQMQKGSFTSAKLSFISAARNAGLAGNYKEEGDNRTNAIVAECEQLLREGYNSERRGDLSVASKRYREAMAEISNHGFMSDERIRGLFNKLQDHNARLGSGGGVIENSRNCVPVNGEMVCQ